MLIDLVAVGAACFPGLASIPQSEKIHSPTVFDTLSKGIKYGREAKSLFQLNLKRWLKDH